MTLGWLSFLSCGGLANTLLKVCRVILLDPLANLGEAIAVVSNGVCGLFVGLCLIDGLGVPLLYLKMGTKNGS